jgi:hypothetical protein
VRYGIDMRPKQIVCATLRTPSSSYHRRKGNVERKTCHKRELKQHGSPGQPPFESHWVANPLPGLTDPKGMQQIKAPVCFGQGPHTQGAHYDRRDEQAVRIPHHTQESETSAVKRYTREHTHNTNDPLPADCGHKFGLRKRGYIWTCIFQLQRHSSDNVCAIVCVAAADTHTRAHTHTQSLLLSEIRGFTGFFLCYP